MPVASPSRRPAARRALAAVAVALAAGACGGYVRPLPPDVAGWRDTESDARRLLQGRDSGVVLDSARVAAVARALLTARERVPEVRDIAADPRGEAFIVVLTPEASEAWRARAGADTAARALTRTGVDAVDSVTARLGGARLDAGTMAGGVSFALTFRRPVNQGAAAAAYGRAAGVRYAGRPPQFGAERPSWTVMIPRGTQTYFVFARACGEGPAARCAGTEYFYVTHDLLTHSAFLAAREVHGGADDGVSTWDVPGRGAAGPYATFDDVLAGAGDRRWWQRRHAVDLLDALLDTTAAAYVPPDRRGPAHLASLRAAAAERRGEALDVLAQRVADDDPDVATLAVAALQGLTHQRLGGGAEGQGAWRAWLAVNAPYGAGAPRAPQAASAAASAAAARAPGASAPR